MPTRLREICDLLGVTQADLVRRSGVSEQTVRELLRGDHPPTLDTARKIAAAFGAGSLEAVFPVEDDQTAA